MSKDRDPKKKKQRTVYENGNYDRYYSYRCPSDNDPRLPLLRQEWFKDKIILDIGCNTGHLTIPLAFFHKAAAVVGVDIDLHLVRRAKKLLEWWVRDPLPVPEFYRKSALLSASAVSAAPPAAPQLPHFDVVEPRLIGQKHIVEPSDGAPPSSNEHTTKRARRSDLADSENDDAANGELSRAPAEQSDEGDSFDHDDDTASDGASSDVRRDEPPPCSPADGASGPSPNPAEASVASTDSGVSIASSADSSASVFPSFFRPGHWPHNVIFIHEDFVGPLCPAPPPASSSASPANLPGIRGKTNSVPPLPPPPPSRRHPPSCAIPIPGKPMPLPAASSRPPLPPPLPRPPPSRRQGVSVSTAPGVSSGTSSASPALVISAVARPGSTHVQQQPAVPVVPSLLQMLSLLSRGDRPAVLVTAPLSAPAEPSPLPLDSYPSAFASPATPADLPAAAASQKEPAPAMPSAPVAAPVTAHVVLPAAGAALSDASRAQAPSTTGDAAPPSVGATDDAAVLVGPAGGDARLSAKERKKLARAERKRQAIAVPPPCTVLGKADVNSSQIMPSPSTQAPCLAGLFPHPACFYDTIMCMSVTKWIHLNHGDAGVKALFRRVDELLKPGGIFILEAQPWSSYKKKCNLTPTLKANFQSIKLSPFTFISYLSEIHHFQIVATLQPSSRGVASKGFKRPIQVFRKPVCPASRSSGPRPAVLFPVS